MYSITVHTRETGFVYLFSFILFKINRLGLEIKFRVEPGNEKKSARTWGRWLWFWMEKRLDKENILSETSWEFFWTSI